MKIKKILKNLLNPEGLEGVETPQDQNAKFILCFDDLVVGELILKEGVWEFSYSTAFKSQDTIKPLTDFPDINKNYKTEALWPFFTYRIPGLSQPYVQKVIQKEGIDSHNIVQLLKTFGQKTITNPFILKSA